MDNEIIEISTEVSDYPVNSDNFYSDGYDVGGIFESPEEYINFMIEIGRAYPEGVPWTYLEEKMKSYQVMKFQDIMNGLVAKGIVEEGWNGDEPGWKITKHGKAVLQDQ
jgi:hypothetical protein